MSSTIGTAYVQILPSMEGIKANMTKGLQNPAASVAKTTGSKMGGLMTKALAAGFGIAAVKRFVTATTQAYNVQLQAETKLETVMKQRMNASDEQIQSIKNYASELQKVGVVGDEVALSGAQQLGTFLKTDSALKSLMPAMENLAVQQNGVNVTSENMISIGNMMGKVMQGQTSALKRVGVTFSEEQEKVLKFGTEEERAAMLAQVITDNVGDMNKAIAATPEGKIQQMKNAFGDLQEVIGGAIAPMLGDMAGDLTGVFTALSSGKGVTEAITTFINTSAGVLSDKLIPMVGNVVSKLPSVIVGFMQQGLPGIVGAILRLIPNVMSGVATGISQLGDAIINAVSNIGNNPGMLKAGVNALLKFIAGMLKGALNIWQAVGKLELSILKALGTIVLNFASKGIEAAKEFGSKLAAKGRESVSSAMKKVTNAITSPFSNLYSTIREKVTGLIGILKFSGATGIVGKVFKTIFNVATAPVRSILAIIKNVVKLIKGDLSFSGLVSKVSSTFNNIKSKITSPITSARNTITGIISRIKGLFPFNLGRICNLKIPDIKISGGKAPWGIGGKGEKPSFNVGWHKYGGVFDGPSVIGVGEAGPEAAIPLSGKQMKPFAEAIAEQMPENNGIQIGSINFDAKDLEDIATIEDFINMIRRAKAYA